MSDPAKVSNLRAIRRRERDPAEVDRAELAQTLTEWRRDIYEEASDEETPGALRTLILRRANDRRSARPILTVPVSDDLATTELVSRLARAAERYASNAAPGSHVALEVAGFYGCEQIPRQVETLGLRGAEDEDEEGGGFGGISPRNDALRAVAAHAAAVLHSADKKDARATRVLQDALDRAHDRMRELEDNAARLFEANLKLADSAAEREAKIIAARTTAELRKEAAKTALALAPAAINRLMGQQVVPEGVHPLLAQLSNLTADLADEGMQQELFGVLLKHGPKGARILQGLSELMAQTATINAQAEALAKGAETAKEAAAEAARAEPSPAHMPPAPAAAPAAPPAAPAANGAPWL